MAPIGVPSGCHGPYIDSARAKLNKEQWISSRGFITGLKAKFFKNGSAWDVPPPVKTDPFIAGAREVGQEYRVRQVGKEVSRQEFSTVTKPNFLHRHPFMVQSQSVRTLES